MTAQEFYDRYKGRKVMVKDFVNASMNGLVGIVAAVLILPMNDYIQLEVDASTGFHQPGFRLPFLELLPEVDKSPLPLPG